MTNSYTTDSIVSQYYHFAWGENHLGVENYPAVCAKLALSYVIQETARKHQYTIAQMTVWQKTTMIREDNEF
jgi:hypothetical protein